MAPSPFMNSLGRNCLRGSVLVLLLSAGCGNRGRSLYPLGEGEKWTYQASFSTAMGASGTVPYTRTNMPTRALEGVAVTPQKLEANGNTSFAFIGEDSTGVFELASQEANAAEPTVHKPPEYYLHFPLKEGMQWEVQSKIQTMGTKDPVTIHAVIQSTKETVTVPAGTFQECVRVAGKGRAENVQSEFFGKTAISVEETAWFCPGVGMVKQLLKETAKNQLLGGGEISIQLESHGKST